jgi:aminoglycoside phosphotransferase (APT) family kinase protein
VGASQDIHSLLQTALHKHCGADYRLKQCRRLSAGASAETYALDVQTPAGEQALILRRSATSGRGLGVNVDKRTEALVQRAATANGVPAPVVLFILEQEDALGEGYVMQRGTGETLPRRILENPEYAAARERLTPDCAKAMAAIHAVPVDTLPKLAALPAAPQLKQIETLYRNGPLVSPVFELALRWLGKRIPAADDTPRLVHGDFRTGNLLVDGHGLQLVLDWELTHLGDPMEDLGWLCVNAWRFGRRDQPVGGFGRREALYAAYESAGGRPVEPERARFWEVFGTLKWGVICILQAMLHLSGAVRSVERAAIGRRVPETELDLLDLIEGRDT